MANAADHSNFESTPRASARVAVFLTAVMGLTWFVAAPVMALDGALALDGTSAKLALEPYVATTDEIVTTEVTSYSLSDTTLVQSKVFDLQTGELHDVVVDAQSGALAEIGAARASEEQRWREAHGALDLSLVKRIEAAGPGAELDIIIFPAADAADGAKGKKANNPLEATRSALHKAGVRGAQTVPDAGHVRVRASVDEIREIVAFLPETGAAYPWEEPAPLALKAAKDLIQTPLIAAHDNGFGSDLSIAVYEPGACINRNHPDFQYVTFDARIGFDSNCATGTEGLHTTPVAGMLAAVRPGETPGSIGLYQGHVFDVESPSYSSMYMRNPDFVNISATTDPSSAKAMDEAVYARRIFIANGSGNDSDVARCFSYNALCVGGYNHANTLGKGQFGDDSPAGSWLNDPESGREEPDVVGTYSVTSAKHSGFGYASQSGTSFATPSITGLAALLTANFEADLRRDPTLLRAVLMASASHPIRNQSTAAPNVPTFSDGIDDRSGAGAPRGDRGKAIMEKRNFMSANLDRTADFTLDGKLERSISFEAARGSTIRVALTWDQCPVSLLSTRNALVADLDMVVDGPPEPMVLCAPEISDCGGDGGGSGSSFPTYEFPSDSTYDKVSTTTTYSTYSTYSYSTAATLDPSLTTATTVATDTQTATTQETTSTESTAPLRYDYTIFAVSSQNLLKSYFSNPSAVDNYEILEFKAPDTGTYRVNITAPRWDQCPYDGGKRTNVAVAWDVLSAADL